EPRQQRLAVDAVVFDVLRRDVVGHEIWCNAHPCFLHSVFSAKWASGSPQKTRQLNNGYCEPATPAFSMMPPQRSISEARNFFNSEIGGLSTGMVPRSIICLWMSGNCAAALSSACSLSMIGC